MNMTNHVQSYLNNYSPKRHRQHYSYSIGSKNEDEDEDEGEDGNVSFEAIKLMIESRFYTCKLIGSIISSS